MPSIEPAYFRRHSIIVRVHSTRQERRRFTSRPPASNRMTAGRRNADRTTDPPAALTVEGPWLALAESVGDGIPTIATKIPARGLHPRRGLSAFVFGREQH